MKKLIKFNQILVIVACASTALFAQEANTTKSKRYASAGTVEFSGSLGFSSTFARYSSSNSSSSTTTPAINLFSVAPSVAYFLTNSFNLGIVGGLTTQFGNGPESTSYAGYLQPGFAFDLGSAIFPYFNGMFGFGGLSSGSTASGIGYGANTGLKIQLAEHLLLGIGLQYVVQNYAYSNSNFNTAINTFSTGISFSYWF